MYKSLNIFQCPERIFRFFPMECITKPKDASVMCTFKRKTLPLQNHLYLLTGIVRLCPDSATNYDLLTASHLDSSHEA